MPDAGIVKPIIGVLALLWLARISHRH